MQRLGIYIEKDGRLKQSRFKKIVLVCIILGAIAIVSSSFILPLGPDFEWTMVNVNYSEQQGDAHFISVRNGKTILIDAGHRSTAEKSLLYFLKSKSIHEIDTVFISHPHVDHYGGLDVLLDNGIRIKEVYFNIPDKTICDQEIPWGCDYADVLNLHSKLRKKGVVIKVAKAGQRYDLGKHTWIDVLYAFDGVNTPVGKTDINDMSLIMMLHHNQYRFLFTGDLNHKIGSYLAKSANTLSADILKVPHHGTEVVAPNIFFEKVAPHYALVPAPEHLWLAKRSERIRKWFQQNNIPVFVNGIAGNIQVTVSDNILNVHSEKDFKER